VGADEAMEEKEQLLAEIGLTGPVFTLGMPPDGSAAARLPDDMVTAMIVLHMPEEHFQDAKTELAAPALHGSGPLRLGEDYFQYMEEEAFRAMMGMLIRLFDTHIRELDRQGRLLILHSVAATTCCRCLAPSAAPSAGLPCAGDCVAGNARRSLDHGSSSHSADSRAQQPLPTPNSPPPPCLNRCPRHVKYDTVMRTHSCRRQDWGIR